jgi:hypothetical protein
MLGMLSPAGTGAPELAAKYFYTTLWLLGRAAPVFVLETREQNDSLTHAAFAYWTAGNDPRRTPAPAPVFVDGFDPGQIPAQ